MKKIAHWLPAIFCGFLSLIALNASIDAKGSEWWRPAFFSFLPMCFFFVGNVTFQMHRELRELRQRLASVAPDSGKKSA